MKAFIIILVLIISGCSKPTPLHKVGDKVIVRGALHAEIIRVGHRHETFDYSVRYRVIYKGVIIKYLKEDEIQNNQN